MYRSGCRTWSGTHDALDERRAPAPGFFFASPPPPPNAPRPGVAPARRPREPTRPTRRPETSPRGAVCSHYVFGGRLRSVRPNPPKPPLSRSAGTFEPPLSRPTRRRTRPGRRRGRRHRSGRILLGVERVAPADASPHATHRLRVVAGLRLDVRAEAVEVAEVDGGRGWGGGGGGALGRVARRGGVRASSSEENVASSASSSSRTSCASSSRGGATGRPARTTLVFDGIHAGGAGASRRPGPRFANTAPTRSWNASNVVVTAASARPGIVGGSSSPRGVDDASPLGAPRLDGRRIPLGGAGPRGDPSEPSARATTTRGRSARGWGAARRGPRAIDPGAGPCAEQDPRVRAHRAGRRAPSRRSNKRSSQPAGATARRHLSFWDR